MSMRKRFFTGILVIFLVVNVYSLIPIGIFYLKKPPKTWQTNEEIVEKLKVNKKPYFSFIVTSDTGSGFFMNEAAAARICRWRIGVSFGDRMRRMR